MTKISEGREAVIDWIVAEYRSRLHGSNLRNNAEVRYWESSGELYWVSYCGNSAPITPGEITIYRFDVGDQDPCDELSDKITKELFGVALSLAELTPEQQQQYKDVLADLCAEREEDRLYNLDKDDDFVRMFDPSALTEKTLNVLLCEARAATRHGWWVK